jgi:hypothetical protein
MTGVGGQQPAQQRPTQFQHRGADRQLHRFQTAPAGPTIHGGGHLPGRQGGQPRHLSGDLPLELGPELGAGPAGEPPFSSPDPGDAAAAGGTAGRASQIASFTSTIRCDNAANRS